LARALNHPGIAIILAVLLIAVGAIGLATGDISKGPGIVIIVVGVLNVLRAQPRAHDGNSTTSTS
jgi:hypothetical protein